MNRMIMINPMKRNIKRQRGRTQFLSHKKLIKLLHAMNLLRFLFGVTIDGVNWGFIIKK